MSIIRLKNYVESFYIVIILNQNKIVEHAVRSKTLRSETLSTQAKSYDDIPNSSTVPCEESKVVSFTSSVMKNSNVFFSPFRFPVKLICYIAFGLVSTACCLLKSFAIFYVFWNNYNLANNKLCNHSLDQ